jgi:hypothetical protein
MHICDDLQRARARVPIEASGREEEKGREKEKKGNGGIVHRRAAGL